MILVERRNKIKHILKEKRSVKVADLVKEFKVSEETIRRDLSSLEKDGLVQKNYGGAILTEDLSMDFSLIPPVGQRQFHFSKEKDKIGKAAAELVKDNQIVIMDAGSTTWYSARHLKNVENLMVISNALNVVEEVSKNDSISIYLLGGKLKRNSMSVFGPQTETELEKYNADYVFLGTSGISKNQGFTTSDLYEAEIKQAMVAAGEKKVLLADHSKLKRPGLISFCSFSDIDILITSELADKQVLKAIEKCGVEIIVCEVD
ncbi:DeoR/GlpR family DNA-binding transcription regulator [Thalassobacillus pellis]|uniref:DeoR/GlpR family DNA-binding transcription regulator n=1 Tax=Thalassobacillus pellis TaxID=748008 RepID=UPI00195FACD0|nr:DeoR/GlpR family DNA-binding transcription regulator [Thalassobacillus pellis]MBM7551513.1 DeoR family transcriptional regulator of aga operon/DeoR family myo-inositol catabolism operon transcriptional repressor [Thalassobacillus pellis]